MVAAVGGHRLGLEGGEGPAVAQLGPPQGDPGPLLPLGHLPKGEGGEDQRKGEASRGGGKALAEASGVQAYPRRL